MHCGARSTNNGSRLLWVLGDQPVFTGSKIDQVFHADNPGGQADGMKHGPRHSGKGCVHTVKPLGKDAERTGWGLLIGGRVAPCGKLVIELTQGLKVGLKVNGQRRNEIVQRVRRKGVIADLETEQIQLSLLRIGELFQTSDPVNRWAGRLSGGGLDLDGGRRPLKVVPC